ncbi:MAG: DUF1573 domain-containing protein [Bacteroidota bacterium]|nr:DUF1573 domain-containing protein [Bacteroidota bacterium]
MIHKKLLLATLVFVALGCNNQGGSAVAKLDEAKLKQTEQNNAFPKIAEANRTHDFGELEINKKTEHTFVVKNEGNADLVIIEAKPSCGCTTPDYTQTPIKPGETGEVKIAFTPNSKGSQTKTVTLKTNTLDGNEVLTIKANVN